jgi:hypothetical protein
MDFQKRVFSCQSYIICKVTIYINSLNSQHALGVHKFYDYIKWVWGKYCEIQIRKIIFLLGIKNNIINGIVKIFCQIFLGGGGRGQGSNFPIRGGGEEVEGR